MPVPIDGKTVLFDYLEKNERLLFIYGEGVEREYAYLSFLNNGLNNDELCFYAFPEDKAKLMPEAAFKDARSGQLHLLDIEDGLIRMRGEELEYLHECLEVLDKRFAEVREALSGSEYKGMKVLIDFGRVVVPDGVEALLEHEAAWRAAVKKGVNLFILHAFSTRTLDNESIGKLMGNYNRVVISTRNETVIQLPGFTGAGGAVQSALRPEPSIISQKSVEQFVKNSLDTIVLAMIHKQPMSGLHIIKTIGRKFNISLSHGTVYPLLHSMTDETVVKIELGDDMKSKIYSLTEKGEKLINARLDELAKTQSHIMGLLEGAVVG